MRGGRSIRLSLLGAVAIALAGGTSAQQPQPADGEAFRKAQEEFARVPNTPGDGPYPAIIETDPAFPRHVIYRPADLAPFEGGQTDIAYPNGADDFARIKSVPAVLANLPVGHGGTFSEPMGGALAHVAVDWLEWQLKGDKTAARTFVGENCRLCAGTDWSIERKGLQ